MSQRGTLHHGATDSSPTHTWGHIRKIAVFTLAITLTSTLTLFAQSDTQHQKTVTVRVDGAERQVTTQKDTVRTLLHQELITLNTYDRCVPPPTEPVQDGMTVTITRVTREVVTRRVPLQPSTTVRYDHRLSSSTQSVLRQGRAGEVEETVVVWKKDGVVSSEDVQRRRTIRRATPTVVVRGTLPSRSGYSVRKVMTMESTAYDPGPGSCGASADGITATGMRATKGVVAVDPRVIPLGTRVYVEGYGPAIAADTGGAIKGNRIDVCFDTRREALRWGRKTVQVVIYHR